MISTYCRQKGTVEYRIVTEKMLNPYGEYVLAFAKNHGISISEAYERPMCKARLDYFNATGK